MNLRKFHRFLLLFVMILALGIGGGSAVAENIDPDNDGSQYAWGENVGWLNFQPSSGPGVTVTDSAVTGYAWGENIGWINLSPTNSGVVNDGAGNLSGYAWGENVGWINFAPTGGGVTIDPNTGDFSGRAWGENIGWVTFGSAGPVPYKVKTGWTVAVVSPNQPPIANAGPDQIVEATSSSGASVTLDGSASSDPDGDSLMYIWTGPFGAVSGVSPTVTIPLGTHTVTLDVSDGLVTATDTVDITVRDTTPPVISSSQNPLPNTNGWNNSDVTVTFTATDAVSNIIPCEIVAMALTSNSPLSVTMNNEGASQTVNVTCRDAAGNSATASHTVNIDKTAPVVTATRTPDANANGWNNTDVTAHFTATDTLSGIQGDSFFDVFFTLEGANQGATQTFTDLAGNTASAAISNINIDKTAPVITITGVTDGSAYVLDCVPTADFTAEDALSGIATSSGTLTGGNSNGVGGVIYTATATDMAGNSTSQTANLSVTYNFIGFLEPINNDGSSVFKQGSTVPIKYQLTDCNGTAITTAVGTLSVFKITDAVTGTTEEMDVDSSGSANTDDLFRYSDPNYIYNLSTKPYTQGTYRLQTTLDDGTVHTVNISLKAK